MPRLNKAARELIESGALAHMVTLTPDGTPQVAIVWMGIDGDELVSAHLAATQKKLRNLRHDPRVVISFESSTKNEMGLNDYLVVHGTAHITEGGAPEMLHELAQTYIAPGTDFPPMPDPPPGFILHVRIDRIGGHGDWVED
jgi:PPOX class probable F420-dependent enzyme